MNRLDIQYGTSFFYPISSVGAHVSACPNHQTGRSVPLSTRADVALAGSFGYELDLRLLSDEEKAQVYSGDSIRLTAHLCKYGCTYRRYCGSYPTLHTRS